MKSFIASLVFLCGFLTSTAMATSALQALPIQDRGRLKPFDTFARETLELIYGKEKYNGQPAHEILMTWVIQPSLWNEREIFEVRHNLVKKGLKLDENRRYFSLKELMSNERFSTLMQDLVSKRETKEKLDPYYQALERLEGQIFTFQGVAQGEMMRFVPPKGDATAWISVTQMSEPLANAFVDVSQSFVGVLSAKTGQKDAEPLAAAQAKLEKAVENFRSLAKAENPELYPSEGVINAELHFNQFHPFKWAWIFYVLGALSIVVMWMFKKDKLAKLAWVFVLLGFCLHIYGFCLRVFLTGRPPVSNMYETVVWVGFGTVLFSMIIEAMYRWRFILLAGATVGAFCLVLADMAPVVLDPSLQPLEPVLRSNFWLTIHVLTITISYAAFFLAFALGDIGLFYFFKGEQANAAKIKAIVLALYRALQIGVSLLAPGIILGGVWADYSWGRFWGWDPKETWALIALLGYVAVLHGRLAGWLKDFGMVCAGILTFSLVVMAWYGVNFVLGAGLHSYGFGAGGVEYVSSFVALHLLAVVFVAVIRFGRLKQTASKS